MKKIFVYFILLIFTISLVSAVEVSTNKNDYNGGDMVTIDVTQCTGTSILKIINPGFNVVDIKSGQNTWSTSYNTLSDSSDGKYTITVSCDNGDTTGNFCVDDPGCLASQQQQSSQNNQGGNFCTPQWSCSSWSFCSNELKQTRDCVDLNNCEQPREEFKQCSPCDESWVCSLWSQCSNRINQRNCFDEHACGTVILKPDLQKSCQATTTPGPQPRQISNQLPPPSFAQPQTQQPSAFKQFWDEYKAVMILGLLSLIILIVIILLFIHFFKSKKMAYNINELKEWVRKERAMGTSNEDIRAILKQHTGWKDEEIDAAFESLRPKPLPMQKPVHHEQKLESQKPSKELISKKPGPEQFILPGQMSVKKEEKVVVNSKTVVHETLPSKQKKSGPRLMKFSDSRTLFKKPVESGTKKISVSRTPPKRVHKKKKVTKKKSVKKKSSKPKKSKHKKISKKKVEKNDVKVYETKKSSKKSNGESTTTTTTLKVKTSAGKGKKQPKEIVKTVKTVVKKNKK